MDHYKEDDLDTLGWLVCMLAALGFLFGALVYMLSWLEWL